MTQQRLEIQRFSPFVEVLLEGENAYDAALSRLKHRFDCSAALRFIPRIAPLFICPAAIVLARGRPFRRCRRSSPCRRDLRTETIGPTSYFRVYIPGSIPRWSSKARIPGSGRAGSQVIATTPDISRAT